MNIAKKSNACFDFSQLARKNFAANEFWDSETAAANKIDNTPPNTEEMFNAMMLLADKCQELRDFINEKINITRGFSCEEVNKLVGGAKNSQHTRGEAADLTFEKSTPLEIAKKIRDKKITVDQCIVEKKTSKKTGKISRWLHVSIKASNNRNEFLIGNEGVYSKMS